MSATLDLVPLEDRLAHLRRDHITHGYVTAHLNEPRREMHVAVDNVDDLERYAASLRLAGRAMIPNRWSGWYGEVWLVLVLDVPRGVFPAQDRRAS